MRHRRKATCRGKKSSSRPLAHLKMGHGHSAPAADGHGGGHHSLVPAWVTESLAGLRRQAGEAAATGAEAAREGLSRTLAAQDEGLGAIARDARGAASSTWAAAVSQWAAAKARICKARAGHFSCGGDAVRRRRLRRLRLPSLPPPRSLSRGRLRRDGRAGGRAADRG